MDRPFFSVGLLYHLAEKMAFLGTCFAYRSKQVFLTAAHCVGTLEPHQLGISLPLIEHPDFIPVKNIRKHPTADFAVLRADATKIEDLEPFHGRSALRVWGAEVAALGYPEDSEANRVVPTGRLFRGSIQRFFTHSSYRGYRYRAGELSFGAPAGLSGGPVYSASETDRVVGVVAENVDSTTYLRSVEELQEAGKVYVEKIHHMIQYGVFVDLEAVEDFVDQEWS